MECSRAGRKVGGGSDSPSYVTFTTCSRREINFTVASRRENDSRIDRILRYLAAIALISEPSEGTYKASHITPHLATPGFLAGVKHK